MRAFITLEIKNQLKKDLEKIQEDLIRAGIQARWVKPENLHLTLVFLGSIKPGQVKIIDQILKKTCLSIKPIRLHFSKTGAFPDPKSARVVFLKLEGEKGKLNALGLKIRKQLNGKKIWFDPKPFIAHLTLGRLPKEQNLKKILSQVKIKKTKLDLDQICLNQSQLTLTGPVYKKIKCASLE